MPESPPAALARLLAEPSPEQWRIAAQVLRQAFAWCATAATPTQLNDRIDALDCLFELEPALMAGSAYLATLPDLIEQAMPGETLARTLEQQRTTLEKAAHELAQVRTALDLHQRHEAQIQAQIAERGSLEARLAELERQSRLAEEVEILRQHVTTVEQHRSTAEHDVEHLEGRLHQDAQALIGLLDQHLAHLREHTRASLHQASVLETDLQQVVTEWQAARDRYQGLETVLADHRDVLRLYQEADHAVAQALGGTLPDVQTAQDLLNRVQQFLEQADQILAHALEARDRANHVSRLHVAGGGG